MSATVTARYWKASESDIRCSLCPHMCALKAGETGNCGVRRNTAGTLDLPFYGAVSSMGMDPIEKKPLYHFHPGSQILSVGFLGCNLHCPFCQNYSISQQVTRDTIHLLPKDVVARAIETHSFGIAYTYNEPTIHFEFVTDCAALAHKAGLKNVLVTNGQLNAKPARELLGLMDGVNVDLKSFQESFYRDELGGFLETTKRFISTASELCHTEVTTLLIPGKNDSEEEVESIARFVASFGRGTPMHISAYYPTYKYNVRATTPEEVLEAVEISHRHLDYVYAGNIAGRSDSFCPSCGGLLVTRSGYQTRVPGIQPGSGAPACAGCGAAVPFRVQ